MIRGVVHDEHDVSFPLCERFDSMLALQTVIVIVSESWIEIEDGNGNRNDVV
jgi:hypothetical protein